MYKSQQNIDSVLSIIKDFVDHKSKIEIIKQKLSDPNIADEPKTNLITIYKTLKIMKFVKG